MNLVHNLKALEGEVLRYAVGNICLFVERKHISNSEKHLLWYSIIFQILSAANVRRNEIFNELSVF